MSPPSACTSAIRPPGQVLRRLRDLGNTVLVIEHDLDLIRAADYVIDIGPGAGKHGGQVVAAGTPQEVSQNGPKPHAAAIISGRSQPVPVQQKRRLLGGKTLTIHGARHNNLQNLTVSMPLGLLTAVSGVSGSGKSSLIFDILDAAGRQRFYGASGPVGAHEAIQGWEHIDKLVTIDQEPMRRMPRSNTATYTDIFTPIRNTFAAQPAAVQARVHQPPFLIQRARRALRTLRRRRGAFRSRCTSCRMWKCAARPAAGVASIAETLAVKYRGFDIAQVLELTIEEALELFQ
jgi:excinuclease ABC subunit A